jgi:hypothetical protein
VAAWRCSAQDVIEGSRLSGDEALGVTSSPRRRGAAAPDRPERRRRRLDRRPEDQGQKGAAMGYNAAIDEIQDLVEERRHRPGEGHPHRAAERRSVATLLLTTEASEPTAQHGPGALAEEPGFRFRLPTERGPQPATGCGPLFYAGRAVTAQLSSSDSKTSNSAWATRSSSCKEAPPAPSCDGKLWSTASRSRLCLHQDSSCSRRREASSSST